MRSTRSASIAISPRISRRILVVLAQAGGEFDERWIEAGSQRREPELFDQDQGIGDRIVGQQGRGMATPPKLPRAGIGHRAVEPAVAKFYHVEWEAPGPDAIFRRDDDIRVGRNRQRRTIGHGRL
jgi:hypothetical protein